MTLSSKLNDVLLTYPCPKCGHPLIKKGSHFKLVRTLKCATCGHAKHWTYDEKVKLFDKHRHLGSQKPKDDR